MATTESIPDIGATDKAIVSYIIFLNKKKIYTVDALRNIINCWSERIIKNNGRFNHQFSLYIYEFVLHNENTMEIVDIIGVEISSIVIKYLITTKWKNVEKVVNKIISEKKFNESSLSDIIWILFLDKNKNYYMHLKKMYNITDDIICDLVVEQCNKINYDSKYKKQSMKIQDIYKIGLLSEELKNINIDIQQKIFCACNQIYIEQIVDLFGVIRLPVVNYTEWLLGYFARNFSFDYVLNKFTKLYPGEKIVIDLDYLLKSRLETIKYFEKIINLIEIRDIDTFAYDEVLNKLNVDQMQIIYFIIKKSPYFETMLHNLFRICVDKKIAKLTENMIIEYNMILRDTIVDIIGDVLTLNPNTAHILCQIITELDIRDIICSNSHLIVKSYINNMKRDRVASCRIFLDYISPIVKKYSSLKMPMLYAIIDKLRYLKRTIDDTEMIDDILCSYCHQHDIDTICMTYYNKCYRYYDFQNMINVELDDVEMDKINIGTILQLMHLAIKNKKYNLFEKIVEHDKTLIKKFIRWHRRSNMLLPPSHEYYGRLCTYINDFYSTRMFCQIKRAN